MTGAGSGSNGHAGTTADGQEREPAVGAALDAMRAMLQEVRVANRAVELELGISGAQLFVLEELAREPADSLNDLAARAGTRHSSMSIVVTRLVEADLVRREASPDDARRVQLAVTARGRRLLRGAPPSAQARLLAAARTLPPAQIAELAGALSAWCASFVGDEGGDPEADAPAGRRARAAGGARSRR